MILSHRFLEELQKANSNPTKLIGQMYDGVRVMSGCLRGEQDLIKHDYPDVQYVHCHVHQPIINPSHNNESSINK